MRLSCTLFPRSARIAALLVAALLPAIGCDTNEDPALLNPTTGDTTRVRFINLLSGAVTAEIVPTTVAQNLAPGTISPFVPFGSVQPAPVVIHNARPGSIDTLPALGLAQGAAITQIILPDRDTAVRIVTVATSSIEQKDLVKRLVGRVVVVNAIDDTSAITVRSGCVSGDPVVTGLAYASSASVESSSADISLFFLGSDGLTQLGSARVPTAPGEVRFIIVTRIAGTLRIVEFTGNGSEPGGPLQNTSPETRTRATLSVVNGADDALDIATGNGDPVAASLQPGAQSAPVDVEACTAAGGDSLRVIGSGGDTTVVPVRLRVGARSVVAVYRRNGAITALDLTRSDNAGAGTVALRALNFSNAFPQTSIGAGAGSPDTSGTITRTFAGLNLGRLSGTVTLDAGTYPFILSDAVSGVFIGGGVQQLDPERYTLLVFDIDGTPQLRLLRDDIPGAQPTPLSASGRRAVLFSIVPDKQITFTVGSVTFPPLVWRGALQGLVPENATSVSSTVGEVPLPSATAYTIGAIGGAENARVIALATPETPPAARRASIRLLAGFAADRTIALRDAATPENVLATSKTGTVSTPFEVEARKYTFILTNVTDTVALARLEGVEVTSGRHYLLVAGDRPSSDPLTTVATLLVQE